ncbi:MAG: hypothetical protein F8N15_01415 [Methanobacterium sp.]|nr:hypothetical protein [Methanobacterium sp.]
MTNRTEEEILALKAALRIGATIFLRVKHNKRVWPVKLTTGDCGITEIYIGAGYAAAGDTDQGRRDIEIALETGTLISAESYLMAVSRAEKNLRIWRRCKRLESRSIEHGHHNAWREYLSKTGRESNPLQDATDQIDAVLRQRRTK